MNNSATNLLSNQTMKQLITNRSGSFEECYREGGLRDRGGSVPGRGTRRHHALRGLQTRGETEPAGLWGVVDTVGLQNLISVK